MYRFSLIFCLLFFSFQSLCQGNIKQDTILKNTNLRGFRVLEYNENSTWVYGALGRANTTVLRINDRGDILDSLTSDSIFMSSEVIPFSGLFTASSTMNELTYLIDHSGHMLTTRHGVSGIQKHFSLDLPDKELIGAYADFTRVGDCFVVPSYYQDPTPRSQFDVTKFKNSQRGLALYNSEGGFLKKLSDYPDQLKEMPFFLPPFITQAASHMDELYTYMLTDPKISVFTLDGQLKETIPMPHLHTIGRSIQPIPERLLEPPTSMDMDSVRAYGKAVRTYQSDFISNLHIPRTGYIQYFYHQYDKEEQKYRVYHHYYEVASQNLKKTDLGIHKLSVAYFSHPDSEGVFTWLERTREGHIIRNMAKLE